MKSQKVSKLPIFLIAGFNLLTLIIYIIVPYTYYFNDNIYLSYVYILLNIILLTIGYHTGSNNKYFKRSAIDLDPSKYFPLITLFYATTFLVKYAYLLKFQIYDIFGMIEHLSIGVLNPKLGYQLSVDESRKHTVNWSFYFLTSIVNNLYFILGFISWNVISKKIKFFFIIFLGIEVFYWYGRGTNFGIITLLLSFLFSSIIETKGEINNRILIKYFIVFVLSLTSFSLIMYSRSEGAVNDLQNLAIPQAYIDENSPLFLLVPNFLHTTILTIASYISQGYYDMSLAFSLDFKPSWFCGWNPSVTSFCSNFGIDFSSYTYVNRLEELGIDPRINWHSSYTWFANDLSFYGSPFAILGIGYLIGLSWSKSIYTNNTYSKIVFISLSSSAILFFANNNYFGYHFYSLMFLIPLWILNNTFKLR